MTSKKERKERTVAIVQTQAENAGAQEIARQLATGFEKRGWRTRQIFFYRRTDSFDDESNVFFCARERPASPVSVLKLLSALYSELRRADPAVVVTLQHYGNIIAAPVAKLSGVQTVIANQLSAPEVIPRAVARIARRLAHIDHGFLDKSSNLSKAEARGRLGLPQDAVLLGCAARLHPLKQLDLAIGLLAENAGQHLALAGQGADLERLRGVALSLGVSDRVHFLGELDASRMGAFLAALDCFVFPSAAESFGLAPVEAAQAGLPVVANDLPVLRDVLSIDDASCALFVDARDTRAFAHAVERVLKDGALSASLTGAGRRLCQRFPLDRMIDQYLALMESA
ncbi:glycosyltransferase family 4 protein [Methylocystis sp. IM3]|uniref:glycosyltransferase family 4 protein n=1 Tax=unclassified Methylocystis TaxID=2625913 RepID=UPI0030F6360C